MTRVTIHLERRPDGGLRVWSDDVPGLVLSGRDPHLVLADLGPALEVLLAQPVRDVYFDFTHCSLCGDAFSGPRDKHDPWPLGGAGKIRPCCTKCNEDRVGPARVEWSKA